MNAASVRGCTWSSLSDSLLPVICREAMMTWSLSGDLPGKVIAAIADGASTREAASLPRRDLTRRRCPIDAAGRWSRMITAY